MNHPERKTMPTYEYRCPRGHHFERFQKMSDPPVASCPECGAKVERILSGGAGFLFKGEGFYITDYRSEEYRKKASAEDPAGTKEKKPAAASAEAGAATTTATSASGTAKEPAGGGDGGKGADKGKATGRGKGSGRGGGSGEGA